MTTTKLTKREQVAFDAAVAEGLAYMWARTHTNPDTMAFVGPNWEDGGFIVDDAGNPRADIRGGTIAAYGREELDASDKYHVDQVCEWYYPS